MDEKYVKNMIATLEFVVSVALVTSVIALFYGISSGFDFYEKLVLVMPGIILGSGVMIALLTYDRQSKKNEEERGLREKDDLEREKRNQEERNRNDSKVFLERVIVAFEEVVNNLKRDPVNDLDKPPNNDRITWVHAAKMLVQAQEIGAQITSPEYKKVHELEVFRTRGRLRKLLSCSNPESGLVVPLPFHFFYGLRDWPSHWKNKMKLDQMANMAAFKKGKSDSSSMTEFNILFLDKESLISIYNFLECPEVDVGWEKPPEDGKHYESFGAREYVSHKKNYEPTATDPVKYRKPIHIPDANRF